MATTTPRLLVPTVAMSFAAFSPQVLDVVAGDTVTWTNNSVRRHTVTASDDSWDSGVVPIGEHFARRFDAPGTVTYYCRLHTFGGTVGVHTLLLESPHEASGPGRTRTLRGRTALAPGTAVAIEADTGAGFAPVATHEVEANGGLHVDVAPRTSTRYRAVAGDAASPPITVTVADRRIAVKRQPHGDRTLVEATVRPAAAGTRAVLQLNLPERFGWWPVARTRLDSRSHARFSVRRRQRVRARIALVLADGATVTATSRPFNIAP